MMGWLNPNVMWALPLAAVPVLIHLLRTQHATRIPFPSLRFVPHSRTAAVRVRLPSDIGLMMVRAVILALAILALAGPIVFTAARTAAWDARIARAIVVDTSESMGVPDATGATPGSAAAEAATAELRQATYGVRIDARDLRQGIARASKWLAASPPARREVVVISDFQRGALGASRALPLGEGIGLRFVPAGRGATTAAFEGPMLLGAGGVAPREQSIEATAETTVVARQSRPELDDRGLRLVGPPGTERDMLRLQRAISIAGTPAGSADQPIAIQFAGAAPSAPAPIQSTWMARTVVRLLGGLEAVSLPIGERTGTAEAEQTRSDNWTTVAWNAGGNPLVRVAASGAELLVDVNAPVDGLLSAEVARAVLTARIDPTSLDEREVGRLDDGMLKGMSRPMGSVTLDAWRTADRSDARWAWLVALILLGAEQWLRGRASRQRILEVTRVAA